MPIKWAKAQNIAQNQEQKHAKSNFVTTFLEQRAMFLFCLAMQYK